MRHVTAPVVSRRWDGGRRVPSGSTVHLGGLAESHFDQITPIVTHAWRYDAALSNDLLAARRSFFGA